MRTPGRSRGRRARSASPRARADVRMSSSPRRSTTSCRKALGGAGTRPRSPVRSRARDRHRDPREARARTEIVGGPVAGRTPRLRPSRLSRTCRSRRRPESRGCHHPQRDSSLSDQVLVRLQLVELREGQAPASSALATPKPHVSRETSLARAVGPIERRMTTRALGLLAPRSVSTPSMAATASWTIFRSKAFIGSRSSSLPGRSTRSATSRAFSSSRASRASGSPRRPRSPGPAHPGAGRPPSG